MQPQHLNLYPASLFALAQAVQAFLGASAPGFNACAALAQSAPPPVLSRSVLAWLATSSLVAFQRRVLTRLALPPVLPSGGRGPLKVRVHKVRVSLPELLALYHNLSWPADPADPLQPVLAEVHRCLNNLSHHLEQGGRELYAMHRSIRLPIALPDGDARRGLIVVKQDTM